MHRLPVKRMDVLRESLLLMNQRTGADRTANVGP